MSSQCVFFDVRAELLMLIFFFLLCRAVPDIKCERQHCAVLLQTSFQVLVRAGTPNCNLRKFPLYTSF